MTFIQVQGKKPLTDDQKNKIIFRYTDKIIELVENKNLLTTSDFQGAVMAIVIRLVNGSY